MGGTGEAAVDIVEELLRLRRENARLRRREHELSALFSSARELAELRDRDAVLDRLVQRAREMMGADVAYLSEFDPDTRELRVQATSGSVSPRFRALRVPPGRGLASVVVETRAAQWAEDYAAYSRDRHDSEVDDAVSAEGLVSLLGVPMLSSDDVLGVLFVGNREQSAFAPEEIALLSALADHASVIVQTTKALRELRESEDASRSALEDLTRHLTERDRANTVHQRLVQAVLAGGGFEPVAETLAAAIARPVVIVDGHDRVIASAGDGSWFASVAASASVRAAIRESSASGHCVIVDGGSVSAVSALVAGSRSFGAVLFGPSDTELSGVDRRTIERGAQVGTLLALQQEAAADAEHRMRSELVADLLADIPERRGDVERRARRMGVDTEALDRMVLIAVAGDAQALAARAASRQLDEHVLVGEHRGYVVAVSSVDHPVDADALRAQIASATGHEALAVVPAPGAVGSSFPGAHRTARLAQALGIRGTTVETAELLPYAAVLDADDDALDVFLDRTIGAVRRYDRERGAGLLATLRAFVRNGASPTRTARALGFHTNTILQRLDRLDSVLGPSWRDDEQLFRIGVAVRLDELRERLSRR